MTSIISDLDTKRFGVRTAKVTLAPSLTAGDLLTWCSNQKVELLIARCDALDRKSIHQLQSAGAILMDTLISFRIDIVKAPKDDGEAKFLFRSAVSADGEKLRDIARLSFADYWGHYHNDPRLTGEFSAGDVYGDWVYRACNEAAPNREVLIAEAGKSAAGFALLESKGDTGIGALYAVAPEAQGQGVYRSLLMQSLKWCQARGLREMTYRTQGTNFIAQRQVSRLGFEPFHLEFTFHKWF